MKHLAQPVVASKPDVIQRLIEARYRSTIHLIVDTVAAVDPDHGGLVTAAGRKRGRPTERFRPIRG